MSESRRINAEGNETLLEVFSLGGSRVGVYLSWGAIPDDVPGETLVDQMALLVATMAAGACDHLVQEDHAGVVLDLIKRIKNNLDAYIENNLKDL